MEQQNWIVFFDGVCNLCNGFVDFVIQRDHAKQFQFASLQGETAKRLLKDGQMTTSEIPSDIMDSVQLYSAADKVILSRSTAVLKILSELGGGYKILALLSAPIPVGLRDLIYSWVAKNRYRLFGKRDVCRRPTPSERDRLLD